MNFRHQLRRVKLSEDRNIIIDCSIELLPDVLLQAQQVGLLTDQYNIIITCLDFHTLELEPFKYGGANITGIRLIDPDNEKVQEIMNYFDSKLERKSGEINQDQDYDMQKDYPETSEPSQGMLIEFKKIYRYDN